MPKEGQGQDPGDEGHEEAAHVQAGLHLGAAGGKERAGRGQEPVDREALLLLPGGGFGAGGKNTETLFFSFFFLQLLQFHADE